MHVKHRLAANPSISPPLRQVLAGKVACFMGKGESPLGIVVRPINERDADAAECNQCPMQPVGSLLNDRREPPLVEPPQDFV
jgi:hypothetical protein